VGSVVRNPTTATAILMLVLTNVFWGVSFPIMKMTNLVMEESRTSAEGAEAPSAEISWHFAQSASFLVCFRFGVALILLRLLYPTLFTGMTRTDWKWGLATGFLFSAGMVLQNMALNDIPASRSGFLTSLSVVFTPILLLLLHRQIPNLSLITGVLCAVFGTAILTGIVAIQHNRLEMTSSWHSRLSWGDFATILAAIFFAGQILIVDRASHDMDTVRITPGMFLATFIVGFTVYFMSHILGAEGSHSLEPLDWVRDPRFLTLTLSLSIVCTIVAFHLMNSYQPYVSPSEAAVIYSLEPLFATLWAMCLPLWLSPALGVNYAAERPGMELILGGSLLIVGNVCALWPKTRSNHPAAPGD
jgi:drug/metabolite transporter (DMT)-like permease